MFLAFSYIVNAQIISGKVTDDLKTPLPFVEITITSINKTAQSNEQGLFEFKEIEAGDYTLHFLLEGYRHKQKNITTRCAF